jgi:hypothetical protein
MLCGGRFIIHEGTMKPAMTFLMVCSIIAALCGCAMKTATAEEITIEGIYLKSLDHPFSGPAIMASGGYYLISGEHAKDLAALKDKTKIKISGRLYTRKRSIPEAGTFSEITENIIEVTKFTVISK